MTAKNKIRYTDDQIKARDHEGSDVVVAASAGSGKTAILIEYIFKKIALPQNGEKVSIKDILAMTFTEAAAASMKKKLFQRMKKGLSEEEKQLGYDEEHLKKEAELLPSADICTIDSFCADILNQYCYKLGWDPLRPKTVLDKNTVMAMKHQAAHELVMQKYQEKDAAFYELIGPYTENGNNIRGFEDILVGIAEAQDKFADVDAWKQQVKEYYAARSLDELPLYQRKWYDKLAKSVAMIIGLLERYHKAAQDAAARQSVLTDIGTLIGSYQDIAARLKELEPDVYGRIEALGPFPTPAKLFPKPGKKDPDYGSEVYEEERERYKPYQKKLNSLYVRLQEDGLIYKDLARQNELLEPKVRTILELVDELKAEVERRKNGIRGIDFVDMEMAAKKILENPDIAARLRQKYKYIVVDEYQDTNDIQEQLVRLICRSAPGNVFRVGDVKQSIYGFRSAKPQIMRNIIAKAKENERVVFHENFRSSDIIIQFNNLIYDVLMNIEGYNDTFTKTIDLARPGTDDQKAYVEKVELQLIDLSGSELPTKDRKIREAYYIVSKIKQMHDASLIRKEETRAEWEKLPPGKERQTYLYQQGIFAEWKDYVILVRNHDYKTILNNAFKYYDVPYFYVVNKGYYDDVAVQTIISWLRWLANVDDEIAMYSILTSPFYELSNDDLADLQLSYDKARRSSPCLSKAEHVFASHEQIRQDYYELKEVYESKGLIPLLREVIDLHDFYYTKTTLEQRDDLDLFYQKCLEVQQLYFTLDQLVDWLAINQKADDGAATSVSVNADVVRTLTIHYSKGLEYPVVFYVGGVLKANKSEGRYRSDEQLGLAVEVFKMPYRLSYKPLLWRLISDKKYQEALEEEIRLMYVATTRAMAKLVIIAFEDPGQETSFTPGGIEAVAAKSYAIGNILRDAAALKGPQIDPYLQVSHIPLTDLDETGIKEAEGESGDFIQPKYHDDTEGFVESSPSSLEERKAYKITYRPRKDAALRGTLIHRAYELMDFKDPRIEDIKVPLPEEDKEKIMRFFKHDLAKKVAGMELYPELPYALMAEGDYMHGFMDLVAIDDKEIILIDYKSDIGKTREEYVTAYKDQQLAYKRALAYLDKPISCYLYALELDEFIAIKE